MVGTHPLPARQPPILVDILTGLAAVAAAVFAGIQIFSARKEARMRATFDHIREIVAQLAPLWAFDGMKLQNTVLAFYASDPRVPTLAPQANQYLRFLTAVDMMALAYFQGEVDRQLTRDYLCTLFNQDLITAEFLVQLQACCEDDDTYAHLLRLHRVIKTSPPIVRIGPYDYRLTPLDRKLQESTRTTEPRMNSPAMRSRDVAPERPGTRPTQPEPATPRDPQLPPPDEGTRDGPPATRPTRPSEGGGS